MSAGMPARSRWSQRVGLGGRIRTARLAAGLSLAGAAEDLTTGAYLSRIEAGERRPSPDLLAALATRVGVGVEVLALGDRTVSEGLRFELAHADLLLASGDIADAGRVAADLAEVADAIGQAEIAHAALVVRAHALAATGNRGAALRVVQPLVNGPSALTAMVASARFHLGLNRHRESLDVGQRVIERLAGQGRLSLPEAADLALTLCVAYEASGRPAAAARMARRALRQMPDGVEADAGRLGAATVSFRSREQVVRRAERAVATLQAAKLGADIAALRAYGTRGPGQEAVSFGAGRLAVG